MIIARDRLLIFDGGMGTYYNELNKGEYVQCEKANISDRETIIKIHREYIKAGAQAIKTNTFAANKEVLNASEEEVEEIIIEGINIAKEAVSDSDVKIFASIGPLVGEEEKLSQYYKMVDLFLQEGIDNFLFETFSSPDYLEDVSKYIKSKNKNAYIITSFAINPQGETREGFLGEYLLRTLDKVEEIDALGFNCLLGPYHMKNYLKNITLPEKAVSIMPNSGYPTIVDNRTYYNKNADYFAKEMREIAELGVKIVGGCCGTTPEFIEKTVEALDDTFEVKVLEIKDKKDSPTIVTENKFFQALKSGKKVIAVEYDPPEDLNMEKYILGVRELKSYGVDGITIADCPVAKARVDASLTAYKIKKEVGIDPIVHMTCRDRNLNATKALVLGLNCEDILNLIVITGDPIPTAQRDEIKGVFNFNSVRLTGYIERLNREVLPKRMEVGGALNINAPNFSAELKKAQLKEKNGTKIFYTQPVLSKEAVDNLKIARENLKAYIMGGIIPVVSHRNAVFMNSEIGGIVISQDIIDAYEGLSKENSKKLAVEISLDFMKEIENTVDGFYLITPFNNVKLIGDIITSYKNLK